MSSIAQNLTQVRQRVSDACQQAGRDEADVQLLAVSKTRHPDELRAVYELGQQHFGENYLQEALEKIEALQDLPICWHFIGPIQSNKTKLISTHFSWVQSVDREKIGRRLAEQRPAELPPLNICLQVNISGEATKSGCLTEQLPALAAALKPLPQLRLRGLMAIPQATDDVEQQKAVFAQLQNLLQQLQQDYPEMDTLSMGMSGDMDAAIAEGASMVRIGTAIFGPRDYSN